MDQALEVCHLEQLVLRNHREVSDDLCVQALWQILHRKSASRLLLDACHVSRSGGRGGGQSHDSGGEVETHGLSVDGDGVLDGLKDFTEIEFKTVKKISGEKVLIL